MTRSPGSFRYREAIDRLYATQGSGMKLGLENTRRLLELVGHPERAMRFIHVAGTNGKGSVCAFLDAGLRASGIRCGLFTSPHLVHFSERILVSGVPISDEQTTDCLERIFAAVEREPGFSPTFFELVTVLGLLHFKNEGVEVAVLETGMGGRLDSTNAVTPDVCIITRIDFDHTQWLGKTIDAIAGEKAGIIKPGVPVVVFPQMPEAEAVLRQKAISVGAPLEIATELEADVALRGSHQRGNAGVALRALEIAGFDRTLCLSSICTAEWSGRFQEFKRGWVLDGAHNPGAMRRLVQTWEEEFGQEKPVIIFGALRDKNSAAMFDAFAKLAKRVIISPVRSERGASPEKLAIDAAARGIEVEIAFDAQDALARVANEPFVLVTGSLFLVGEILAMQQEKIFEPSAQ